LPKNEFAKIPGPVIYGPLKRLNKEAEKKDSSPGRTIRKYRAWNCEKRLAAI
jgi:hypothetical protein